MSTVLSTKTLSLAQKELLLNSGIGLVAYNAIEITFVDFEVDTHIENAIFTSQNAVKAIVNKKVAIEQAFCVGEKTKRCLEENGQKVALMAKNASELAKKILKEHKNEAFTFFSGNKRREELPSFLKANKIALQEKEVYKTTLLPKKIRRNFDGILFFSPSAVVSYVAENTLKMTPVFCIGETTAKEAAKYTKTIIIANKPSIENTIVQAIKFFKNDLVT